MSHHYEDEPRDWHGRWTTGGATALQRAASDKNLPRLTDEAAATAIQKAASDKRIQETEQGISEALAQKDLYYNFVKPAMNNGVVDSVEMYRQADGTLTPEREALHQKIIDEYFNQGISKTNMAWVLGGAPANGKSTLVDSGAFGAPKEGIVHIDADAIKQKLPEYSAIVNFGNYKEAAAFAHEESSMIVKRLTARSAQVRKDMLIDAVNDGDLDKVIKKMQALKDQGYYLKADYVSLDSNLSLKLAEARSLKTKRYVPEPVVKENNREISRIVPELAKRGIFDDMNLWDTNINGKPRLVLSAKGGKVTIHDQELYNNFLKKANEKL